MATGLQNTFSGADVTVIFGEKYIGECMSFTVGVNREAGPLYTMGRKEPIAIPKGKRGIGGSFILAQLGYDALLRYWAEVCGVDKTSKPTWIRKDEMLPILSQRGNETLPKGAADPNNDAIDPVTGLSSGVAIGVANELWTAIAPNYVDQLPPFNATVIGVNEQGGKMGFRVYGLTIINEGIALSIEELNMEKRYTFIAQAVSKMTRLD